MRRFSEVVAVNREEQAELEHLVAAPTAPQLLVKRARVELPSAAGCTQLETSAKAGVSRPAVVRWEGRFASHGLAGYKDAPGRGRKASIPKAKKEKLLAEAMQPPPNRSRWSPRSMTRENHVEAARA
jgi:transposase